jgi:hypothetical protein
MKVIWLLYMKNVKGPTFLPNFCPTFTFFFFFIKKQSKIFFKKMSEAIIFFFCPFFGVLKK